VRYQGINKLEIQEIEQDRSQSPLKAFIKKFRPDPKAEQEEDRLVARSNFLKKRQETLGKEHAALQAELDDLVKRRAQESREAPHQT
jgi:hypothetical protein